MRAISCIRMLLIWWLSFGPLSSNLEKQVPIEVKSVQHFQQKLNVFFSQFFRTVYYLVHAALIFRTAIVTLNEMTDISTKSILKLLEKYPPINFGHFSNKALVLFSLWPKSINGKLR